MVISCVRGSSKHLRTLPERAATGTRDTRSAARGAKSRPAVLHWNPAREFYRRLGFEHNVDWLPYRVAGALLEALAAEDSG